jgi:hypothetical protein
MKLLDRLLVIVVVAVILSAFFGSGYLYRLHIDIQQDIRHGRLTDTTGVYYLSPVPSIEEVAQLRRDNAFMTTQLNARRRR